MLFALVLMASCSTQKKVVYFQDLKNGGTVEVAMPQEIKIKPGDKLSVHVNSKDEELVAPFNLRRSQASMGSQTDLAYTVDKDGDSVKNEKGCRLSLDYMELTPVIEEEPIVPPTPPTSDGIVIVFVGVTAALVGVISVSALLRKKVNAK